MGYTYGVQYVVVKSSGGKYLREATQSARSLRKHSPKIPIVLYTDLPGMAKGTLFRDVRYIATPPNKKELGTRIEIMGHPPFDRNILLDADTYICADISNLFDVLDMCDVAMAYSPRRKDQDPLAYGGKAMPDWFPEVCNGVIVYKNSAATQRLVREWSMAYTMLNRWQDQISMRMALYKSVREHGLRFHVLPPEYDCRVIMLQFAGSRVHIIHGREDDAEVTCRRINSNTGCRMWMPGHGIFQWKDWKYVGPK